MFWTEGRKKLVLEYLQVLFILAVGSIAMVELVVLADNTAKAHTEIKDK